MAAICRAEDRPAPGEDAGDVLAAERGEDDAGNCSGGDTILGQEGRDELYGGARNDTLRDVAWWPPAAATSRAWRASA